MDTNFVFPRPQAAIPRSNIPDSASQSQADDGVNRNSNALRNSVLETALELGIGRNSTMTKWMFSNAVAEEADEEPQASPGLTSGSTATSESSHASGELIYSTSRSPLTNASTPNGAYNNFSAGPFVVPTKSPGHQHPIETSHWSVATIPAPLVPPPPPPVPSSIPLIGKRNKLKKKHGDGYESDGGYVSDSAKKRKDKEKKKKEQSEEQVAEKARKEQEKEDKKRLKEETKAAERSRKKSTTARTASTDDFETDNAQASRKSKKKSKKTPSGDGYETEDGYMSSSGKRKKSFFKRRKDDVPEEPMPRPSEDVPLLPPMPLPIAERFATTPLDLTPTSSLNGGSSVIAPSQPIPTSFSPPLEANSSISTTSTISPSVPPSSYTDIDDMESVSSHSHSTHSHSSHSHGHGLPSARSQESDISPSSYSVPGPQPGQIINQGISYPIGRPDGPARPPPLNLKILNDNFQRGTAPSPHVESNSTARLGPSAGRAPPFPPGSGRTSPLSPGSGRASPLPGTGRYSPQPPRAFSPDSKHASQLSVIPSMDFIVPSPQHSTTALPSPSRPNINDLPPPSPPPTSPLPQLPPQIPAPRSVPNSAGGLAPSPLSRQISRETLDPPESSGLQRGRTSPFPTRPVQLQASPNAPQPSTDLNGFEARVKIPRYRELYAMPSPTSSAGWGSQTQRGDNAGVRWKRGSEQHSMGIEIEAPSDDEMDPDVDELRDALMGRFTHPASDEEDHSIYGGESALDRSQSFNLRKNARRMGAMDPAKPMTNNLSSTEASHTNVQPRVRFADEADDSRRSPRPSTDRNPHIAASGGMRWSQYTTASVYSRGSFVDDEKSEEMRGRLLNQIGAMYDENGRERDPEAEFEQPLAGYRRAPIEKF